MKWVCSTGGKLYARLLISHVVDTEYAAHCLLVRFHGTFEYTPDGDVAVRGEDGRLHTALSPAAIEREVRAQLANDADKPNWWSDDWEDYPGDVTADHASDWALAQVRRAQQDGTR